MLSANGGLPAHRYTPQVTPRWPRGSEPASPSSGVYGGTVETGERHPLMRWVEELEEVRVERTEEVRKNAILQALESQMDRCAEAEEVEDIREQLRLALE